MFWNKNALPLPFVIFILLFHCLIDIINSTKTLTYSLLTLKFEEYFTIDVEKKRRDTNVEEIEIVEEEIVGEKSPEVAQSSQ